MDKHRHYKELFLAMSNPAFYPDTADRIEELETHISKIFLVGDYVYKIKKPFDLGFLDFTTLENREHFCKQEILLNRRLSCNVYIDVVPITFENGQYTLGGNGEPVEYAVKMRRLCDDSSMINMLRAKKIKSADLEALSCQLASFYSNTSKCEQMNCIEVWESVKNNWDENFIQTEVFIKEIIDRAAHDINNFNTTPKMQIFDSNSYPIENSANKILDSRLFQVIKSAVNSFVFRKQPLFDNRVKDGKIRDCHGDLRTDHIYFVSKSFLSNSVNVNSSCNSNKTDFASDHCASNYKEIQIIDCIEFNERFRLQDIASDLAFLVMDMDYHGFSDEASLFLDYYVKYADDPGVFILLDFYKCYRAMVRCKVNCFRLNSDDLDKQIRDNIIQTARRYLELAYTYALKFARPKLFILCGMQASGKSTIAKELADFMGIELLSSDIIRKELFKIDPIDSSVSQFEQGIYSKSITNLTYGRMFLQAQEILESGSSVILDATFAKSHFRDEAKILAQNRNIEILFVECYANESVVKKRLIQRENNPSISDARIIHFDHFKSEIDSFDELEEKTHIRVDTSNSLKNCIKHILSQVYAKGRG